MSCEPIGYSTKRYPFTYFRSTPYTKETPKQISRRCNNIYVCPNPNDRIVDDAEEIRVESIKSSEPKVSGKSINDQLAKVFLVHGIDISNTKKIGGGHYSRVYLARMLKRDGSKIQVALKVINEAKQSEDFVKKFLPREIACWKKLHHPFLIKLYGHYSGSRHTFLTSEYAELGDLLNYVQRNGALSECKSKLWSRQIIEAIGFMHANRVSHRDIKLENIMVFSEQMVKVGDFGFAKDMESDLSLTHCGSKSYSAPEILGGKAYNPYYSDSWAVGIVIFIMTTNRMPFQEDQTIQRIIDIQKKHLFNYPKEQPISFECRQVIKQMLQFLPENRPNKITEILKYQWFQ